MFYTVSTIKNSLTNYIKILECDEEVKINLDDTDVKLLNVDNIKFSNIIGVAYISYEDLYVNKKSYDISYYETYFDYDDVYFFGLTLEKATKLVEHIKTNI